MSRGPLVVFAWAAWITVLTAVLVIWRPDDEIQWLPFAAMSAAIWVLGLAFWMVRRARSEVRLIPDLSPGSAVLALGLATMLGAPSLGIWVALLGGGIALFGVAVLARELLTERRLNR